METHSSTSAARTPDANQSGSSPRVKAILATRHIRGVIGTVFMSAGLVLAAYAIGPMGPSWLIAVGGGLFANGVRVVRWRP
ncbi:hypothetical protein RDV64_23480 (plasmid) [Acuticoccus sp. MNP-M23]|uniref:hypothetical protein n=1 Tax=Acuticoccus sp. MNP-M23 TaxID=3072793 RepID=UPI0028167330|nr:hypothetical protein [Acuticoccus sp. MNP-M23]WMS45338.1 hypothetical protein RDV64_23480 [Acuticoccus sp. MNP-M23]